MLPRLADSPPVIEKFEDRTDAVQVPAHVPGTGKSFGYLALEVLNDHFPGSTGKLIAGET